MIYTMCCRQNIIMFVGPEKKTSSRMIWQRARNITNQRVK